MLLRGCPIGSAAGQGKPGSTGQEKEAVGITGACLGQMNLLSTDLQRGDHQPTSNVQRSSGLGIEVHPEGGL